mgnify:CR=1 FL=1
MMLGAYPFMLNTAAYQQLKRNADYRWKELDRIGRKPAQQYIGPGADQITLEGEILPHWKGGTAQVDVMRAQASLGVPLVLLEGYGGFVLGTWVILKINETKSELMGDGTPRVINFSMTLKEYGEDQARIGGLGLGLAAVATLARLI